MVGTSAMRVPPSRAAVQRCCHATGSRMSSGRAIDEGRVLKDGQPYSWEPDEMVLWLREHPEERGEVALERDRTRFTVLPQSPAAAGL